MSMERPEFIITFRDVAHHHDLVPSDATVFGYIYWMTRLKNEKCYASNDTLARLAGLSVSTVRNSLTRLEQYGFIKRVFSDVNATHREEILPLMSFSSVMGGATPVAGGVLSTQQGGAISEEHTIKKSIKEEQLYIVDENPKKVKTNLEGFESWWNEYPRKANKVGASAEWRKLSSGDRSSALEGALRVAQMKTDVQFLPMPDKYLANRRWEDQLEVKAKKAYVV